MAPIGSYVQSVERVERVVIEPAVLSHPQAELLGRPDVEIESLRGEVLVGLYRSHRCTGRTISERFFSCRFCRYSVGG